MVIGIDMQSPEVIIINIVAVNIQSECKQVKIYKLSRLTAGSSTFCFQLPEFNDDAVITVNLIAYIMLYWAKHGVFVCVCVCVCVCVSL